MQLQLILPVIYQSFLNQKILKKRIQETQATCDNCLKARDHRFRFQYDKNLKCCTFFPFLPNYAVGGILTENLPGAERLEKIIKEKSFSLPLGIFPNLHYQYRFQNKKENEFGNNPDLICPYYDLNKKNCTLWKYRGVVCTTYCRSDYGQKGLQFWEIFKDYLSYVEMALAEDCLVMKDFSPRDISDQLVFLNKKEFTVEESVQTFLQTREYRIFWNGYTDEIEFYKSCYKLVQKLNRSQFVEILGQQGLNLEKNVLNFQLC